MPTLATVAREMRDERWAFHFTVNRNRSVERYWNWAYTLHSNTVWSNRIQSNVNNALKWKINNRNLFNALRSFVFEGCEAWKNIYLLWILFTIIDSKSNQTINGFSINILHFLFSVLGVIMINVYEWMKIRWILCIEA